MVRLLQVFSEKFSSRGILLEPDLNYKLATDNRHKRPTSTVRRSDGNQYLDTLTWGILPVARKMIRSQMLVTRSAILSTLWAAQIRYVARVMVLGSSIM